MDKKRKKKIKKAVCERCGETNHLTIDHIIPQFLLVRLGFLPADDRKNLQTLCQKCNTAKGHQLDPKNPRTIPLMRHYFQRWVDLYGQPRKRRQYVFRNLPVKSLTPDTYYFCEEKKALQSIFEKQK